MYPLLALYAVVLIGMGVILRGYLMAPRSMPALDTSFQPHPAHLGYITGGAVRARDVWWTQLREAQWLAPAPIKSAPPRFILQQGLPLDATDAGLARALSSIVSPTTHDHAMRGFLPAIKLIQAELVKAGWLYAPGEFDAALRLRQVYRLLLVASAICLYFTSAFVSVKVLFVFIAVGMIAWTSRTDRVLPQGHEASSRWMEMNAAVRQAPRSGEAGMAVALGGALALYGTPFGDFAPPVHIHHLNQRDKTDGSSSGGCGVYAASGGSDCGDSSGGGDCGGSSGCGSSGCGGGGCGS